MKFGYYIGFSFLFSVALNLHRQNAKGIKMRMSNFNTGKTFELTH